MNRKLIGSIGCILLMIGVFSPIISAPIMGNVNYLNNGEGDGLFVLGMAIAALVLIMFNQFWFCYVASIGSAALMLIDLVRFQTGYAKIKSDMDAELADNPFRGIADAVIGNISLQWGWLVLGFGCGLVLWAAILKSDNRSPLFRSIDDLQ